MKNTKLCILIAPKSKYCLALVTLSLRPLAEFCSNCWICQSCYMNFAKLLYGFVKIDKRNSLGCYMDLSMLLHGFLNFFQCHFMYFSPFAQQNEAALNKRC